MAGRFLQPKCSHCGSTSGLIAFRGEWWCGDRLIERIETLEKIAETLQNYAKEPAR